MSATESESAAFHRYRRRIDYSNAATRNQVIELVRSLGEGVNSIAILGHENQVYIQTAFIGDRDEFGLDFRNGEPRQHYTVNVTSKELVLAAFLSYFDGDNRWRTMVERKRDPHYERLQG
ncbi:hypothetical protein L0U85_17480 [Glycomyces sp. L485]|uniref:hypothetical protein n=1 Tax=Glycomyces sp. L485 TaxID=2909235 RepID=UPI001F4B543A|nr:hypothetical protein [Glycomyces sp. L485]MCH7232628.1 hypothetical protein [Glycomyces sp. L485]